MATSGLLPAISRSFGRCAPPLRGLEKSARTPGRTTGGNRGATLDSATTLWTAAALGLRISLPVSFLPSVRSPRRPEALSENEQRRAIRRENNAKDHNEWRRST
ncbi:hypothetical protein QR680_008050 [Steinernema hermaphroditum]|uniref:Uncharacterized protein n=1 Tax=Steinernema hermaphroditum TaxID=289476 RepID=A0AA39M6Z1_9BILA|nr:hypothetical protein QR680_008050 [Steinernema hermaphroditum]